MSPRISLEQWRALIAVVDAGGYAQAAAALHKSQSAVTYAVQKLQSLLGVQAFEIQGRKAVLTEAGQVLYRRGLVLIEEAVRLERAATHLAQGWEPELSLAVETIFPTWLLLDCLNRFAAERPDTRIELYETVLGGTDEAVLEGRADIAIASRIPVGFSGSRLRRMRFVCAAAPQHPLHQLGRPVSYDDLRRHRHLVIRDSGTQRTREGNNWLGAEQRWTVSNKATSIRAATLGLGFAWYAENIIRDELARGELKALEVVEGSERFAELYLILPQQDASGPGARRLAELIREGVATLCVEEDA
ncbi:MAG TPA: LysR family transcriptional regulator [Fontimonas sp.]